MSSDEECDFLPPTYKQSQPIYKQNQPIGKKMKFKSGLKKMFFLWMEKLLKLSLMEQELLLILVKDLICQIIVRWKP